MTSRIAPARLLDYKRRGPRLGNQDAAREQRAEQQQNKRQNIRSQAFLQKRAGLCENTAPPEPVIQKEAMATLSEAERKKRLQERLKSYREHKKATEAKRKEEARKHPPFVVPGIAYKKPDFFNVQKDGKAPQPQPTPRPVTVQNARVTRSQARALVANLQAPNKPVKKEIKKTPHPSAQKGRRVPLAVLNAPQERKSFAPANFQFSAPVGLQNYVFQKEIPVLEQLQSLSLASPVTVRPTAPLQERRVDPQESSQTTNIDSGCDVEAATSDSEMAEAASEAAVSAAGQKVTGPMSEGDSSGSDHPLATSSSSMSDSVMTPQSRTSRRAAKKTPNPSESVFDGTPQSVFSASSPVTVEIKGRDVIDSVESLSSAASFDSDVVLPRSRVTRRSKKDNSKPLMSSTDESASSQSPKPEAAEPEKPTELVQTEAGATITESEVTGTQQDGRDISYFRNLIVRESEIFDQRCGQWEQLLNDQTVSVPEDPRGSVLSAIGQAKLLQKERFAQFSKLIDQCQHNSGEKEINFTDLDGFWDMIYFQVEDVHKKFAHLEKLRANNWVEEVVIASRRGRPKKQPVAAAAGVKQRPAAKSNMRAMIAEARAKALQAAAASPALTPASKRLSNLRRSANAKSARKSIFEVQENAIREDCMGEAKPTGSENNTSSKQPLSAVILDESVNCPVRPLSPQVPKTPLTSRRKDPLFTAHPEESVKASGRNVPRASALVGSPALLPPGSVLLSDLYSERSVRRSSRLMSKGFTPIKTENDPAGTPAQSRRLTRRRIE